jgi:CysZ protein
MNTPQSTFSKDFNLGMRSYVKSFGFIMKHRMGHFYLYPLAFIVLFSLGAVYSIDYIVDSITPWVNSTFGLEPLPGDAGLDQVRAIFREIGRYVIHAVVWISLMLIYYKINKYFILIVMSPVMAVIAERTESIVTGRHFPFSWLQLLKDVFRGTLIAVRNAFVELSITIGLLVFNFFLTLLFPPASVLSTPLISVVIFFVGAYFYGFSTIDYTGERHRLSFRQGLALVRRNRGIALANGTFFSMWLIIPIFGTYVGTIFAPITCTVGATLALLEKGEPHNSRLEARVERVL